MSAGEWTVRASIWIALACYPAGPFGLATRSAEGARRARALWTLGAAAFFVHAVGAFHFFYDWSHRVAVEETARQVAEVTGRAVGTGSG